jgi:hypothetical protein
MDTKLQEKCDLLAENYKVVNKSAKLDFPEAASLGALIYTGANANASEEDIRANRALLKEKVSIINNLRGNVNIALLCKMSLAKDAEAYLDNVIEAYGLIKRGHIYHDEFEALAATAIVDFAEPAKYDEIAQKTQEIIKKMHEVHPILTNTEDTTIAALLAMSDLDIDAKLEEAEKCYEMLKGDHFKLAKDSLQSICMILALNDMPVEEKCARFSAIRQALKDIGDSMTTEHLAILAALVDIEGTPEEIAAEIKEAEKYLKGKSGFGSIFGIGKQLRMVLASAVILQTKNEALGKAGVAQASANALTAVITEQIIMAIITFIIMCSILMHNSSVNTSA